LHFDIQDQPEIGYHIGVVGMRWATRFVRVIAHFRAVLVTMQRFDGRIRI